MTKTTILAAAILLCLQTGITHAQDAPDGSEDADSLDTISVVGTGQTRQVQALGKDDLSREAAGASPLKAVAKLPGVNFQSADPWGNYEWSTKLSIRGFSQQQLGFTLDGIPLGDMSYGNHNGLVRDDDLLSFTADWSPSADLSLAATAYYHRNEGQGHWATPYSASPTVPIRLRTTEYDIERTGLMPSLTWQIGDHRLQAGLWLEKNAHGVQRNFYDLRLDTPPDDIFFYRNPDARVFRQRFDTDTRQFYMLDHMEFVDGRLAIDAGFKGTRVEVDGKNLIGTRAGDRLVAQDNFQPQLGARWRINDTEEVFGSYAENMAA